MVLNKKLYLMKPADTLLQAGVGTDRCMESLLTTFKPTVACAPGGLLNMALFELVFSKLNTMTNGYLPPVTFTYLRISPWGQIISSPFLLFFKRR